MIFICLKIVLLPRNHHRKKEKEKSQTSKENKNNNAKKKKKKKKKNDTQGQRRKASVKRGEPMHQMQHAPLSPGPRSRIFTSRSAANLCSL
jgi:hypothetical protein